MWKKKKKTTATTNIFAFALIHECTAKILIGIEFEYTNPVLLPFDLFLFGTHTHTCMHCVFAAIAFSQTISISYIILSHAYTDGERC